MSTKSWFAPPSHHPSSPDELESVAYGLDGTRLYVRRRPALQKLSDMLLSESPKPLLTLLCDGIACEGFIWKYLWDDLAELSAVAHWHYRGHGRSASPVDPKRIQIQDFASDLNAVRDHLDDPYIVLIGHSMGVQVVLEAYRARPEKIVGLILCCGTSGKVTETFQGSNALAQALPKIEAWVEKSPEVAQALWSRLPTDLSLKLSFLLGQVDASQLRPEDLMPYIKHIVHVDIGLFVRVLRAAGEHSADDLLPSVRVPTLIMAGEKDSFIPPEISLRMATAIPNSESVLIKNGSHAALIEQPLLVHTHIHRFWQEKILPFIR